MAGGPRQPRVVRWPAAVAGTLGIRRAQIKQLMAHRILRTLTQTGDSCSKKSVLMLSWCVESRANRNYSHIVTKDTCNTQEANQLQTGEDITPEDINTKHKQKTKRGLNIDAFRPKREIRLMKTTKLKQRSKNNNSKILDEFKSSQHWIDYLLLQLIAFMSWRDLDSWSHAPLKSCLRPLLSQSCQIL